jgi:hypothetical protein
MPTLAQKILSAGLTNTTGSPFDQNCFAHIDRPFEVPALT